MSDKLIWQSKENPIEVVYDSIYGMSIEKCMEILKNYHEGKLIPVEFLEKWFGYNYYALTDLKIAWEKENEAD